MKATHINYKHPRHLRVIESDGRVMCYSPSVSTYNVLTKKVLPDFGALSVDQQQALMPGPDGKERKQ